MNWLEDCIVTIDAMGCQKSIAKKVVKADCDYVFGLKENQSNLHEDVKLYFENLSAIGAVKSTVYEKDEILAETRYFITSLTDVEVFSKAVRTHWGIENSLHWCLDVVFREDYCRTRKDNSAENFAVIRRIAFNILKKLPC